MVIAVDFDGTIVEHKYPQIGKERPFALETLCRLQQEGHLLILWTVRQGRLLDEAVTYCRERGLEFNAINRDLEADPECQFIGKLKADLFIDDRNVGGLPDWGEIYRIIVEQISYREVVVNAITGVASEENIGFWGRWLGR